MRDSRRAANILAQLPISEICAIVLIVTGLVIGIEVRLGLTLVLWGSGITWGGAIARWQERRIAKLELERVTIALAQRIAQELYFSGVRR